MITSWVYSENDIAHFNPIKIFENGLNFHSLYETSNEPPAEEQIDELKIVHNPYTICTS